MALFTVNGKALSEREQERAVPQRLLIDFLRDDLYLTGTHQGCDTAQCGACTVLIDGRPIKSCNILLAQINRSVVTTIEGLATEHEPLHPMQLMFSKHHALQCGYCTPGFVMRAVAMATEPVAAEPDAVKEALAGNICRCTGYYGIVAAVCEGLQLMRAQASMPADQKC